MLFGLSFVLELFLFCFFHFLASMLFGVRLSNQKMTLVLMVGPGICCNCFIKLCFLLDWLKWDSAAFKAMFVYWGNSSSFCASCLRNYLPPPKFYLKLVYHLRHGKLLHSQHLQPSLKSSFYLVIRRWVLVLCMPILAFHVRYSYCSMDVY